MKNKQLQELLRKYPDDVEVLICYGSEDGPFDGEIVVGEQSLYHCRYTTKWQSHIDYYSISEGPCIYKDDVGGRIVKVEIPTEPKKFIILDA